MFRFFTSERRKTLGHWAAELGIVVAGVLIALYAQQWDSDRNARKNEREANERIRQEVTSNAFIMMERLVLHRCQRERLQLIAEKLKGGDADFEGLALPPFNDLSFTRRLYRAVSRNYSSSAFNGAVANGALDATDPARRLEIAGLYDSYAKAAAISQQEYELASQLDGLFIAGPLELSERRRLLATVSLLDRYNGLMALIARQSLATNQQLGLVMTPKEAAEFRRYVNGSDTTMGTATIASHRARNGNCVDPSGYDFDKQASMQ